MYTSCEYLKTNSTLVEGIIVCSVTAVAAVCAFTLRKFTASQLTQCWFVDKFADAFRLLIRWQQVYPKAIIFFMCFAIAARGTLTHSVYLVPALQYIGKLFANVIRLGTIFQRLDLIRWQT